MPVTLRFDGRVYSFQEQIIQDATPTNDGLMTAAQAAKLASLSPPGAAETLQGAYDAGGAGPQIIQLTALGKEVQFRDTTIGGSGNPILTIGDSAGTAFYQFQSTGLTVGPPSLFNGLMTIAAGMVPSSDLGASLGDAVTPLRFFRVCSIDFLSGDFPMSFTTEALTGGVNPVYQWDADGDIDANLTGPVYRFNVGNEPHQFIEFQNASTGAIILGYQGGAARTALQFNNLGLTVTRNFGGSIGSSHFIPGDNALQFLGLTSNRWLLVAAGISGEFSSSASPVSVTNAKHSIGVSGAGARTVNLPAANTLTRGFVIYVQDTGNSAGAISITPNGADTINGVNASVSIAVAFGTRRLVCDGVSAWFSSGVF